MAWWTSPRARGALGAALLAVSAISLVATALAAQAPGAACAGRRAAACAAFAAHLEAARTGEPDSVWAVLRYVATAEEARSWRGLTSGVERVAFVRRFWATRAAASAGYPEERFAEHLRRLAKARALFPRGPRPVCKSLAYDPACMFPTNFAGMAVAYPPGVNAWVRSRKELRIDDRGLALVRHGEPDRRSDCRGYPGAGEVWVYAGRGGAAPRVLLFSTVGGVSDFVLVNSALDLECDEVGAAEYLGARGLDARDGGDVIRRRLEVQREVVDAASTETALPPYAAPLAGVSFDLLDFADTSADASELTVAVSAPASALRLPPATGGTASYRLGMALVLYDSTGVVARLDTLREVSGAPLPDGSLLSSVFRLSVPPGAYRYALRIERDGAPVSVAADSGSGVGLVSQGTLALEPLRAPDAVRLSALAIGRAGVPADWRRGDVRLALNPTHVIPLPARRLELYYEAYGPAEGDAIETEIVLESQRRRWFRGPDRIAFRFREDAHPRGPAAAIPARRSLDLRQTQPGDYRLRVRVRRVADGRAAVRETTLHIR
ncbi:MAG TPA: hypothetical protein VFQ38_00700 [Longimicrobiales bacterium]|nr:hypothetical protein [Longimicrobiales bacterium]